MKSRFHLLMLLVLLGLTACSGTAQDAGAGNPEPPPGSPAAIAATAVGRHTNTAPGDVQIVSVEALDFGDSSLGCPQPGMAYMQVITPGHKVIAALGNRQFDVRVAGGRGFICEPRENAEQ